MGHYTGDRLSVKLCLVLSRLFLTGRLTRYGFRASTFTQFESGEEYIGDRIKQVENYQTLFNRFCTFRGKIVLELGCSKGYLLDGFMRIEKFDAIGADIEACALEAARACFDEQIQFVQSTATSIPLQANSVDVVYTIDTVEHLSRPHEIFLDMYRIMRPGGVCLVHFHPWLGPYGSHLGDIVPFPWPHILFSMDTLLTAAARLYGTTQYRPAWYYFDQETGQKKPNPFLDRAKWDEYLNKLTIRQFKNMLEKLPFEIIHFERIGFGGTRYRMARYLRALSKVPGLDELFTGAVFSVLRKPTY